MRFQDLVCLIRSDLDRYKATGAKSRLRVILLYQTFWATCHFRLFTFLYSKTEKNKLFRLFVSFAYYIGFKQIQILTSISIPVGAKIGKGLYLAHFGPILISGGTRIGDNCNLGNQVIIGYGRANNRDGHPTLGNRVFVGPGAKIFGPVKIGNDVAIGANAVVTHDIPDRAVVVGIPAEVISYQGSFFYIKYPKRERDEELKHSWEIACQMDPSLEGTEDLSIKPED